MTAWEFCQLSRQSAMSRKDDCNEVLCNEVATKITHASKQRGFVFLDPYGLQVAWDTILALSATRALDVFINFPIMGVKRLLKKGFNT